MRVSEIYTMGEHINGTLRNLPLYFKSMYLFLACNHVGVLKLTRYLIWIYFSIM